jgi:hypothetical protein
MPPTPQQGAGTAAADAPAGPQQGDESGGGGGGEQPAPQPHQQRGPRRFMPFSEGLKNCLGQVGRHLQLGWVTGWCCGHRQTGVASNPTNQPTPTDHASTPPQALGIMEVRTVLVSLLSRFWFELAPAMGKPEAVRHSQQIALTLKIKGGLQLTCRPHSSSAGGAGASVGSAKGKRGGAGSGSAGAAAGGAGRAGSAERAASGVLLGG